MGKPKVNQISEDILTFGPPKSPKVNRLPIPTMYKKCISVTSSEAGNLKKLGFAQRLGGLHGSQWQLHLLSPIFRLLKVKWILRDLEMTPPDQFGPIRTLHFLGYRVQLWRHKISQSQLCLNGLWKLCDVTYLVLCHVTSPGRLTDLHYSRTIFCLFSYLLLCPLTDKPPHFLWL